ncbi:MAG: WbuC family cupin fold metalloprotein [Bacteroidota bacterium]
MSKAFPNPDGPLITVNRELLDQGIRASRKSERLRKIYPIHRKQSAPVQRMLNFLQPGTYIQPHLHPRDGAVESMYVIQGKIDFITFDEQGTLLSLHEIGEGTSNYLVDIVDGVWHSFVVRKPDTVLFEVKMGPYDAMLDKTFAKWAPKEGDEEVPDFLRSLDQQIDVIKKQHS